MVTLTVDRDHDDPVYEQVADQMRQLIASGALKPGSPLPSVRQLAGDLGVSLNTIARAYRRLEAEGFLVTRDRAGVVAAAPATKVEGAAQAKLLNELRASLARLRQAGLTTEHLLRLVRREVQTLDDAGRRSSDD
jgi:DNA-binding transcriptional regulator YhcF (GntR family)